MPGVSRGIAVSRRRMGVTDLDYFLHTAETVPDGLGFSYYDGVHLGWLGAALAVLVGNALWYRRLSAAGRSRWEKTVAILLLLDELFKDVMLLIGGRFLPGYLPLHLCSVNIFVIAVHAWKKSPILDNFLYTVCIPGALAALLFPGWSELPLGNFMHLHSFTVHILLVLYPVVLTLNGRIRPELKYLPGCLLLLAGFAALALGANLLWDTNFMFLMWAEPGNPLYLFQELWGNHLYGYPILIAAVLAVMYLPVVLMNRKP